jgi:hypothetical protein
MCLQAHCWTDEIRSRVAFLGMPRNGHRSEPGKNTMKIPTFRRTLLLSAFGFALSAGLLGQAMAGEQLSTIQKNGTLKVGL